MNEIYQYKIRLNLDQNGAIKTSNGILSNSYDKDFYINVPIYKTNVIEGYVDVEIDPMRTTMQRQFINPFFIELGFFEDVESILSGNTNTENSVQIKSKKYGIDINK